MLETKKIKEIKNYAKEDLKDFFRRQKKAEEYGKIEEFNNDFPEGATSYYAKMLEFNESKEQKERLKKQFGYTEETLKERAEIYHEAFWSAWKWWNNKIAQNKKVLARYKPIFKEAEEYAKKIDVSDIKDGFPCGMAVLYLDPEQQDTDLGKVLRSQYDGDSYSAKVCNWSAYKLPIKLPSYGQCMSYDERICHKTAEFLEKKGIKACVYSMID